MKIDNVYKAITRETLLFNDMVIIENGEAKKATHSDLHKKLYSVIDVKVCPGQIANLAGSDTVFHIEE